MSPLYMGIFLVTPADLVYLIPGIALLFVASISLAVGVHKPNVSLRWTKIKTQEQLLLIFGCVVTILLSYIGLVGVGKFHVDDTSIQNIVNRDSTILAGSQNGGLYISTDGADHWRSVTTRNVGGLMLSPNYANDSTLLYAAGDDGVFKSTDRGENWYQTNSGIPAELFIYSVTSSPNFASDLTLFAGTGEGVLKSTDGGANWNKISNLDKEIIFVAVSPNYFEDHTIFAGGYGNSLIKSTDDGVNWKEINLEGILGLDESDDSGDMYMEESVFAFSPNFSDDSILFIASNEFHITDWPYGSGPQGFYTSSILRSNDGGGNWNRINSRSFDTKISSLAISPDFTNDNTIIAGTENGVFTSTDGGSSWQQSNDFDKEIGYLAISPNFATDHTIFASAQKGLFRSTDGGASWNMVDGLNYIDSLVLTSNLSKDQTFFAGSTKGLFKSNNGGVSWTSLNNMVFIGIAAASLITVFGIASLGEACLLVTRRRRTVRQARAAAIELSKNLTDVGVIVAQTGCEEAETAMFIGFVSDHNRMVARLDELNNEAEQLKHAGTAAFLREVENNQDYLAKLMRGFSAGNAKSAVDGLKTIAPSVIQLTGKLQRLKDSDEEIGATLADLTAKLEKIRQMVAEARTGLADLNEIDLTDEFSQLDEVEQDLHQAEASLQKGAIVKLPDGDRIGMIVASGDEKVQMLASLKTDLPEFTRQVSDLLTEISEAMKGAAPLESEKQTTKQMLGTVKQINDQMAEKKLLPARKALDDARDELEKLTAQVECKAALPQQFEDSIENRISILLESWKMVTPDMLTELYDDSREWALVHYFERHKDKEAILLRGTTLVTADAGATGNIAPPPAPAYDGDAQQPQKANPASGGFTRLCSNCKSPLDEGQKHCGRCGTIVID